MKKGNLLGKGATAEIYTWDEDKIIKVFKDHIPLPFIEQELHMSQQVEQLGLHVPKVYESVTIDGQQGIIYEKIDGPTMTKRIASRPWTVRKQAKQLAKLHFEIHQQKIQGLPSQKGKIKQNIDYTPLLSAEVKGSILQYLDGLQEGDQLCHGDFHPDNVLLSSTGPIVIDWTTGTCGNPLADVARTVLILKYASLPSGMPVFVKFWIESLRKSICEEYLKEYFALSGLTLQQIMEWELPIAAARLIESIPEDEKERLLRRIHQLLR